MLPLIGPILDIVNKFIPDADKKMELQKEILKHEQKLEQHFSEYAKLDNNLRIKEMEHKGWKAAWRPFLMFSFGIIVVLYCLLFYIMPGIVVYFNLNVWIPTPPIVDKNLWDLVMYSILGIGGMRTVDKWRKS